MPRRIRPVAIRPVVIRPAPVRPRDPTRPPVEGERCLAKHPDGTWSVVVATSDDDAPPSWEVESTHATRGDALIAYGIACTLTTPDPSDVNVN